MDHARSGAQKLRPPPMAVPAVGTVDARDGDTMQLISTRRPITATLTAFGLALGAPARAAAPATPAPHVLRVCAAPNNLPYSNERQEGFENRIAELVAREM